MFASTWWREPADLDSAQQRVAELPATGRYLLTGKPGSGKTNLLVLRARYLSRANRPNLKVITWTRLIREFIVSGTRNASISEDQLQTFLSWGAEALRSIGMDVVLEGSYDAKIDQVMNALESAGGALPTYDGVLVDETQDYRPAMIHLFARMSDRLFFVGDEKQRIYGANGALSTARELVDEEILLPRHYRNGHKICMVAQAISGEADYLNTSGYDERALPSSASFAPYESVEAQVDALIMNLDRQLRAYPDQLLGVMVPYQSHRSNVIELLRDSTLERFCQFQTRGEGYRAFDEERPIVVCSIHGAKGLEFRAAHIVAMEGFRKFHGATLKNLAYTAVSRAKTTLTGYYSGEIPAWLRSAFHRADDAPEPPGLADLFS